MMKYSLKAFNIKILFIGIFLISYTAFAEDLICTVQKGYNTYSNPDRKIRTKYITPAYHSRCKQISKYVYQIEKDGKPIYVHRSAIAAKKTIETKSQVTKISSDNTNYSDIDLIDLTADSSEATENSESTDSNNIIVKADLTTDQKVSPEVGVSSAEESPIKEGNLPKGYIVHVLKSRRWVPTRSEPNQNASFNCNGYSKAECKAVKSINASIELKLTGNRTCDQDSKICFIETTFNHGGKTYTSWFDENNTDLDPEKAVRLENARVATERWLNGTDEIASSIEDFRIAMDSESQKLRMQQTLESAQMFVEEVKKEKASAKQKQIAENMFLTHRGLIRMHNTRNAMCGSYDYSEEGGLESYANPTTACAITKLAETWRKEYCPRNTPCRLEIGDISHRTKLKFDGHSGHKTGECFDLRPIRKTGQGSLTYKYANYDQAKTIKLLKLLKRMGGTSIFFNDPASRKAGLSKYYRGHDNHIHVCFKANDATVQNQCNSYQPDEKMCPTANILFNHPYLQKVRGQE